jgi:hypothetical protein
MKKASPSSPPPFTAFCLPVTPTAMRLGELPPQTILLLFLGKERWMDGCWAGKWHSLPPKLLPFAQEMALILGCIYNPWITFLLIDSILELWAGLKVRKGGKELEEILSSSSWCSEVCVEILSSSFSSLQSGNWDSVVQRNRETSQLFRSASPQVSLLLGGGKEKMWTKSWSNDPGCHFCIEENT